MNHILMKPAQPTNQTTEDDIRKINEAIEALKMKDVQTLEGNLTG